MTPVVSGRRLARGLVALLVSVVVAVAGSVAVVAGAEASPPPERVLADARAAVGGTASFTLSAAITVSSPADASGDTLVQHWSATAAVDGASRDLTLAQDAATTEFRTVAGAPGLWVRSGFGRSGLASARWVHAESYATYESSLLRGHEGDPASGDTTVLDRLVLLDRVADGSLLPGLLRGAGHPRRQGGSTRSVAVVFDPDAVLGPEAGRAVDTFTGTVTTTRGRVSAVAAHLGATPTSVDVTYALAWDGSVAVRPPAPSDIAGEV